MHLAENVGEHSRWEAVQLVGQPRQKDQLCSIDVRAGRFPYCIVWTALPGLTMLFPFIGHMGIADSRGVIYDFAGPYTIGIDDLAFGKTLRFVQLDPSLVTRLRSGQSHAQAWDAALDVGCDVYEGRMHNIVCDNCHSHVARVLNEAGYAGYSRWNMVHLAVWLLARGTWVSATAALSVWAPFLLFLGLVLGLRYGLTF